MLRRIDFNLFWDKIKENTSGTSRAKISNESMGNQRSTMESLTRKQHGRSQNVFSFRVEDLKNRTK